MSEANEHGTNDSGKSSARTSGSQARVAGLNEGETATHSTRARSQAQVSQESEPDDDDWREDDDYQPCDCGGDGMNGIFCPLCCGGVFSPGSEECDFCDFSDECSTY
jgi:hypothetical protein